MKAAHDAKAAPELIHQLGEITRQLHQSLQQLGLMPQLQQSAAGLPDAHGRLDFIANKNAAAAERVLSVVEQAQQEQRALRKAARQMAQCCGVDPARQLPAAQVLAFAGSVEAASARIDQQLTDIMLAQDFHDLTGQVIRKVVTLAQTVEEQLLKLLLETTPPDLRTHESRKTDAVPTGPSLDGPVVKADGRGDVVTDQTQVDDLLASLGF
jgi:chemotaxis protein CheZ